MNPNVGGMDKVIRIVLGIVLIALTLTNVIGWWGWINRTILTLRSLFTTWHQHLPIKKIIH